MTVVSLDSVAGWVVRGLNEMEGRDGGEIGSKDLSNIVGVLEGGGGKAGWGGEGGELGELILGIWGDLY